ncbi:MAG: cytochrome c [Vulcanimicrobiaceae bacterium]|jgi:mono/diheme cytochrome c family protein
MHRKSLALLAVAAIAMPLAAGCSKGSDQSSQSGATSAPSALASGAALGDPKRGQQIFSTNCSTCHGKTGREGGIGPSLTDEKSRKDGQQTITWIHNPQPPMPKLWPSPLNDKDVADVAAYVQTL